MHLINRTLFCLQIRTLGMLRYRFQSLPGAFNACLVPAGKDEKTKKKGLKATFSSKFEQVWFLFIVNANMVMVNNQMLSGHEV